MKNSNSFMKKTLSVLLSFCMTLTLCTTAIHAEEEMPGSASAILEESAVQEGLTEELDEAAGKESEDQLNQAETYDSAESGEDGNSKSSSDADIISGSNTDSSDAEGANAADKAEVSITSEYEENLETKEVSDEEDDAEEEEEFEETGILDLTITDRNGSVIKPWYDSSSNTYYLFLTNAITISEVELPVKGIKIKKTSRGELDSKTNVVEGGFTQNGDSLTLTAVDETKYNFVVKQSGLPSVSITLNGTTLKELQANGKDQKYKNQTVLITDASGNVDITQSDAEFKGRGNSTWNASRKKPYQIKFSKKQSVLGMSKAKKWVLLANAFDDTMLRNKAAYSLGDSLGMNYTPDMEFADLWIDGEYLGTYTIGEKVEVDSNRLNLSDSLGALVEVDNAYYAENDYYYYDSNISSWFCLSEEVDESNSQETMDSFQEKTSAFTSYLRNTKPEKYTFEKLSQYIDVESFAKWYLIEEYLTNYDSYFSSFYWYTDGPSDVLHVGPIWDFDTSSGSPGDLSTTSTMFTKTNAPLFNKLMQSSVFAAYVKQVYTQYRAEFSTLPAKVDNWANTISASADMNYIRWPWLGTKQVKGKAFESTYAGAVSYMKTWLTARDSDFGIEVPSAVTAQTSVSVSANGKTLTAKASDVTGTSTVKAAVWSSTGGQDDLKWYSLTKASDGTFSKKIDLTAHGSSDTYYIHFYSGTTLLGTHTEKVTMTENKPEISATYAEGTGLITVTVKNISSYKSLNTAIWSAAGGQDDLKWISTSVKSKNQVKISYDASSLKHRGPVHIHVYGTISKQTYLGSTTVTVTEAGAPVISAVQTEGGSVLDITAENLAGWTDVKAAVWGAENAQNDIVWYSMTKNTDGSWSQSVNLGNHNETGLYYIHVYGKKSGKQTFIGDVKVTVTEYAAPVVTVKTVKEGETLQAELKNVPNLDSVSIAVWGNVGGQNDIKWYSAKKQSNGNWRITVKLENHRETGAYYFHAYGKKSGKQTFQVAAVYNVASLNFPYLEKWISSSGRTLNVSLENGSDYSKVRFAVWGNNDGQNDLKWYSASQNLDGSWSASIGLASHKETGVYNIHTYGTKDGKNSMVAASTVTVSSFGTVAISAEERGTLAFQAKAENTDDYSSVRFAVWTEEDGQDDLQWYKGLRYSDSSARATVLFSAHDGNGTYNIHAYGTKDGKEILLGICTYVKI